HAARQSRPYRETTRLGCGAGANERARASGYVAARGWRGPYCLCQRECAAACARCRSVRPGASRLRASAGHRRRSRSSRRDIADADMLDHAPDLFRTEHNRQLFGDGWTEQVAEWPGTLKCVGVEELDAVERDVSGVRGQVFVVA